MVFTVKSTLIDITVRKIYTFKVSVENNKISSIEIISEILNTFILLGFVDTQMHIESNMLVPSEFASIAVTHSTVGNT